MLQVMKSPPFPTCPCFKSSILVSKGEHVHAHIEVLVTKVNTSFIPVLHVQGRLRDGDQLQRHLQARLHDEGARPTAKD